MAAQVSSASSSTAQGGAAKDTAREIFVVGLRNAHALEREAVQIMQRQVDRIQNYPEVSQRLKAHIAETEEQARRLEQILSQLGESTSTLKDLGGALMGNMAALAHSIAGDEILKNTFANNAFENFEIASYMSLMALARQGGFTTAIPLLERTLEEERRMAEWVESNVEKITLAYLQREQQGVKADR